MTPLLTEIEERLQHFAGEVLKLFAGLAELLKDLPPSPQEQSAEDLAEEPDRPGDLRSTDLRSTVLCVLNDLLRPAVYDLLLAAGAGPEEAARRTPVVPGVPAARGNGKEPAPGETPFAGARAEATVTESMVPVPPEIALFLGLALFDVVAMEPQPDGVLFEPLRAVLGRTLFLPIEDQRAAVQAISQRKFTLMLGNGLVLFPPGAPPLRPGDRVVLQVEQGEHGRRLRVSPAGPLADTSVPPEAAG